MSPGVFSEGLESLLIPHPSISSEKDLGWLVDTWERTPMLLLERVDWSGEKVPRMNSECCHCPSVSG